MKTTAILAAFALAALTHSPAAIAKEAPPRILQLAGHGEIKATPDIAFITIGVVRTAPSARQALMDNTKAMRRIFASLKEKWSIADKDMATSGFSVSAQYHYPKNKPRVLTGYRVANMLTVRVRELDSLGGILDAVVQLGANDIQGISFAVDKPAPKHDEARRLAVRDALRKAKIFAREAGFKLGRVLRFTEQGGFTPPPRPVFRSRAMTGAAKAAPVPTARGEQTISADVNITWEIE